MRSIEQILEFLVEAEKLKIILRKTMPAGQKRRENSAEYSWHACLAAVRLKDCANEIVDINRVIKRVIIHDLGEIDIGDTIVYAAETSELKAAEELG